MNAENFSWESDVEMMIDGVSLDLHNCFNLSSVIYDVVNRKLSLTWQRGEGCWIKQDLPSGMSLAVSEVDFLRIDPRDAEIPYTEDDCLESFGYESEESWCDGHFSTEGPVDPTWRWSFAFQSDARIVVHGSSAKAKLVR